MQTDTTPKKKSSCHIIHNQEIRPSLLRWRRVDPNWIQCISSLQTYQRIQIVFTAYGFKFTLTQHQSVKVVVTSSIIKKLGLHYSDGGEWTQIESNVFLHDKLIEGNKMCTVHVGSDAHWHNSKAKSTGHNIHYWEIRPSLLIWWRVDPNWIKCISSWW